MTQHICPRCGYENTCRYGNWFDRHSVMATIGGLSSLTFMGMMFSVYTSATWTMVALAATVIGVRALGTERQRRAALVARADWEHAQLMARSQMPAIQLHPYAPLAPQPRVAERHVMNQWPTTPIRSVARR